MEVVKYTEFQVKNILDPLITEFTKCSDRSFLHDGEAPQANMLIVMHCLMYFTTCTVFPVVLVIFVYLIEI